MDTGEEQVPFGTFRPFERRALVGCAFGAGCIQLLPGEVFGAAIAFIVAISLAVWHSRRSKEELAASEAAEREA